MGFSLKGLYCTFHCRSKGSLPSYSFQTLPRSKLLLLEADLLLPVRRAHGEGGSLGHDQGGFAGSVHRAEDVVENVNPKELPTVDSEADVEESAKGGRIEQRRGHKFLTRGALGSSHAKEPNPAHTILGRNRNLQK